MFSPSVKCLYPRQILVEDKLGVRRGIYVGCGHCIQCKMKRTREWTVRLIMEAQDYNPEDVVFTTLTYEDEHLPVNEDGFRTLSKRDWQLFMKRLRKSVDDKLRFYAVGEYGLRTGRPHMHAIIFGLSPDKWHFIERAWQNGFVMNKSFYKETCGYVAGYIQKKLFGCESYGTSLPPFLLCSQHLGENWFMKNIHNICHNGFISLDGFKYGIPRLFRQKAIDLGLLPETDIEYLQILQNTEMHNWECHLSYQDCSHELYESANILEANESFKKRNIKRDFNTEV